MRRVWGLALFCLGTGLFIALIFPENFSDGGGCRPVSPGRI